MAQRSKRQKRHQNNRNHNRFAYTYSKCSRVKSSTLGSSSYVAKWGSLVLPDSYKKKLRGKQALAGDLQTIELISALT